MPSRDLSPTKPGHYWLALVEDGYPSSRHLDGAPFLVSITHKRSLAGYWGPDETPPPGAFLDDIRVTFHTGDFNQIMVESWAEIAQGVDCRVSWNASFGGLIPMSRGDNYRLAWLKEVRKPKLPRLSEVDEARP